MRILGPILMAWAGWVSVTLIQMGQDIAVIKKQVAENARVTTEIPAAVLYSGSMGPGRISRLK